MSRSDRRAANAIGRAGRRFSHSPYLYLIPIILFLLAALLPYDQPAHTLLQVFAAVGGMVVVLAAERMQGTVVRDSQSAIPLSDAASLEPMTPHASSAWPTAGPLPPRQIPTASVLLAGREEMVRQVSDYLLSEAETGPRVVILYGSDGVGKTDLAIAIAHAVARRYPDGQLFADLGPGRTDPGLVSETLADFTRALDGHTGGTAELRAVYESQTSDRAVLAVLDDAPVGAITALLPHGSRCAAIVTCRQPPAPGNAALLGALCTLVGPIENGDSLHVLREIMGRRRIDAELDLAHAIIAHTGGLPLALRAAAATLAAVPDTKLAAALSRCDQLPPSPETDRLATLDFAYAQLPDAEKRTLRAIGLLDEHTVERWQLAALLGSDNSFASRTADRLCLTSLLTRGTTDAAGVPRYRVHAQVLAFAKVRLALETTVEQRTEMTDRLASARNSMVGRTADPDEVRRGPLNEMDRGKLLDAINHARDAVARARESRDQTGEALTLVVFAEVRTELGSFEAAADLARSAVDRAPAHPLVLVRALRCRARLARRRRQWQRSEDLLSQAISAAPGHRAEQIQCLRDLSVTLTHMNRLDDADARIAEAVALADTAPSTVRWLRPKLYWALSLLREAQQRYDASVAAIEDGCRHARDEKQDLWLAWLELRQSDLLYATRDWQGASRSGFEGIERFATMQHRYGKANAGRSTAMALLKMEDRGAAARRILEDALETFVNCGDKWAEAETRRLLAQSLPRSEGDKAAFLMKTANDLFGRINESSEPLLAINR